MNINIHMKLLYNILSYTKCALFCMLVVLYLLVCVLPLYLYIIQL